MWVDPASTGAVVVGCDRSWESQNAVVAATCEASRRGCELVLIAVVETQHFWPDGLVSRVVSDFTMRFRDNGACLLLPRSCCVPVMNPS